jgi:membrane associated rhomboid family serine protease
VLPYHDENETQRTAYVTLTLIALNVLAWLVLQGAGSPEQLATSVCNLGLIAGELTMSVPTGSGFPIGEGLVCLTDPGPQALHIFTSMFMHGSWVHLIGNMWFLWLFGNNVEDSMTRGRFLVFYLLCGVAAVVAQVASDPSSVVPMVGASGAISGVMGGYLVLYPRVKVFMLVPFGLMITTIAVPAWAMIVYWAVIQFASGIVTTIGAESGGGVAFWAHVGGFVAGVALVLIFRQPRSIDAHESHHWNPRRAGWA